ncbi:sterol desaturase family protein [Panacibacter sp. DH6]|uniref:Sterol desaturase family protein n=1 Tax=Panacibacter microcysteis TaxID=2793269 RepID=A0A931MEG6_9BACT|nr:sterol desaturase family protein [Panacibacter microcysteis]MBG9378264.1 sterol desaturase family protein [Panacibacter microcysteis]
MKMEKEISRRLVRDILLSVMLYALPVLLMLASFYLGNERPWITYQPAPVKESSNIIVQMFRHLNTWGLTALAVILGICELAYGLYANKWSKNERTLDIVCFIVPKIIARPFITYVGLLYLPVLFPNGKDAFAWVPFWWGCLIIAVADDLTQYWYHRLHHQVPWLWRFHRTHHSAEYMGMAMASRQNIIYTIFFSQIYLTTALVYLGLGYPALFVGVTKSLIVLGAHSSLPWDKPFYKYKLLRPFAWVLERVISTPATHHAHHADTHGDGIGYYKGNFGNMFFLWDIIFGTGHISRQYPAGYGIKHYRQEEWYAQFLWPIIKSKKEGSELAANGPMVGDAVDEETRLGEVKEEYAAMGAHV